MANIDVSELMVDPDFVDAIQIINRTSYVDNLGQNHIQEVIFNTVGSVQPADFKTVQRLPEALRVENLYSFWVKADIILGGNARYPSLFVFHGKRFQVRTVSDWSNFGEGYSEGTCVCEDLT